VVEGKFLQRAEKGNDSSLDYKLNSAIIPDDPLFHHQQIYFGLYGV